MRLDWKRIGAAIAALLGIGLIARRTGEGGTGSPYRDPGQQDPVDPYAPRDVSPTAVCDPTPKPGVLMFRRWAIDKWGQREKPPSPQNISRACDDKVDEHQEGRAWDLMTRDLAHGQEVVDALLATGPTGEPHELARRAGIMYLIWNKQMWRAYPHAGMPAGSWHAYTGASPHTDHVHLSFSHAGAAAETSLYRQLEKLYPVA